jgi:hypothetical protein
MRSETQPSASAPIRHPARLTETASDARPLEIPSCSAIFGRAAPMLTMSKKANRYAAPITISSNRTYLSEPDSSPKSTTNPHNFA